MKPCRECAARPESPRLLTQVVMLSCRIRTLSKIPTPGLHRGRALSPSGRPNPAARLGVADGEEPYLFTDVENAFEAPDGRIVIVDGGEVSSKGSRELRVFDQNGRHLLSSGGAGEGPGEFGLNPTIRLVPPDTILAWDYRLWRLTWFAMDGTIVSEESLVGRTGTTELPIVLIPSRWALHPGGSVFLAGFPERGTEQGWVEQTFPFVIMPWGQDDVREIPSLPDAPGWRIEGHVAPVLDLYPSATWGIRTADPSMVIADDRHGSWGAVSIRSEWRPERIDSRQHRPTGRYKQSDRCGEAAPA